MHWPRNLAVKVLITVFLVIFACPLTAPASQPETGDNLTVSGVIADAQGKGLKEAEIELLVNGQHVTPAGRDERLETGSKGGFVGGFTLPQGTLPEAQVKIRAVKPSWQTRESEALKVLEAGTDAAGNRLFQVQADLTLKRRSPRASGSPPWFCCWCTSSSPPN